VTFVSWSDHRPQRHTITTPPADSSYTAFFTHGYARPKTAGPIRVPLVVAYRPCTAPNAAHNGPLAYPSCKPPARASSYLTAGTPDANGLPARFTGYVRFMPAMGDPATPVNEADVGIDLLIADVLDHARGDNYYVGDLEASTALRITDSKNGDAARDSGTLSSLALKFQVPCAATVSVGGSTCALATSANALAPGMVTEGARAIWELGQVQVYDGGADGIGATEEDNTLYATQGVFIP
jgi:hypothetical protein